MKCRAENDGFACDREPGHSGSHRGYNAQIDEPMFWPPEGTTVLLSGHDVDALRMMLQRAILEPGDASPSDIAAAKGLLERMLAALRFNAGSDPLRDLIWRVVTGDGAQLENLSMTDEDWQQEAGEDVDITIPIVDWLALVRVARAVR